jgi:hypothetical protein
MRLWGGGDQTQRKVVNLRQRPQNPMFQFGAAASSLETKVLQTHRTVATTFAEHTKNVYTDKMLVHGRANPETYFCVTEKNPRCSNGRETRILSHTHVN